MVSRVGPRTTRRPAWSLTTRLVLTVVALVAAVSLTVTAATALTMQGYLTDRLDAQVAVALARAAGPGGVGVQLPSVAQDLVPTPRREDRERGRDGRRLDTGRSGGVDPDRLEGNLLGQGGGTLLALLPPDDASSASGLLVPERRSTPIALDTATLQQLRGLPVDGRQRSVTLDPPGRREVTYRVLAARSDDGGTLVVGLPTSAVTTTVGRITTAGLGLSVLGVLVGAVGGLGLVRRQLRPLRDVAATAEQVASLPLAQGAVDLHTRVPAALADGRTEVGQVGGALNTLLDAVGDALDERHRSEQRVRRFVADASHELRTPLTTIAGYAQLARRTPDDATSLGLALRRVEDQSERMRALVEDLLLLARLDSGRPLEVTEVDLTHLVLESVTDARVVAPDHRWRLDLPDVAVTAPGDRLRLQQVVSNLLTNAARHTPGGTTVTTSLTPAEQPGGEAILTVHDDGPGIDPVLEQRVFERFTRGDDSRTRGPDDTGGAGLGLSLVHAIVDGHGGSVDVVSRPGTTTFTVRLRHGSVARRAGASAEETPPGT